MAGGLGKGVVGGVLECGDVVGVKGLGRCGRGEWRERVLKLRLGWGSSWLISSVSCNVERALGGRFLD